MRGSTHRSIGTSPGSDRAVGKIIRPAGRIGPAAIVAAPPAALPSADPITAPRTNPDEVRFEIPKNFTVTAGTSGRGLVLMIMNHRLERQNGYAFAPDAAKQVADGLIKSADAALEQSATSTK